MQPSPSVGTTHPPEALQALRGTCGLEQRSKLLLHEVVVEIGSLTSETPNAMPRGTPLGARASNARFCVDVQLRS